MRKIYITGCAHSGTTMLLGLMHAFGWPVIPAEITEEQLAIWANLAHRRYDGIIGKRSYDAIFSSMLTEGQILEKLLLLYTDKIEILHITRNKEDVLRSHGGEVSEERYDACVRQATEHRGRIKLAVTYEEILMDPVGMQATIEMYFGLKRVHDWADYPDFVPDLVHLQTQWPPRPLGAPRE